MLLAAKLLKQAPLINQDGHIIIKQIIKNTCVSMTPTTVATKTCLLSLGMQAFKNNIITFDKVACENINRLKAVLGHTTSGIGLIKSLFIAYTKSNNDSFLLKI
jgi:hypothetical protein